jgi:hypothetical protein
LDKDIRLMESIVTLDGLFNWQHADNLKIAIVETDLPVAQHSATVEALPVSAANDCLAGAIAWAAADGQAGS